MAFWKKSLILLGILIALGLVFNSVIMPWYVKHDTLVKVPSVEGLSFLDAKKKLDAAGLEGLQGDIRYDPNKPIATVLDQNPPADQVVKYGRRIYLIISGGEQLYDVPNLVGRTVREARFMLSQRNIELQEMEMKPSVQYPAGLVLSQIEPAGSKVKKGTKIGVVVSTGMETGDLKVPDLTGKNIEEAKKLIAQSKLTIGKITYQPSLNVPVNSVIDQYPKANSMTKENQKIDLFINRESKRKIITGDEENGFENIKPEKDKTKEPEIDKNKEPEKKDDSKKDIKPKPDKKDDKKKPDVKPKDDKKTTDGGTKF
jgi:beta-lactam-binding protein with PASTA domain